MSVAAVWTLGFLVVAAVWSARCVWAAEKRPPGREVWITIGGWIVGGVGGLVTAAGVTATVPWLAGAVTLDALLPLVGATFGAIVAWIVGRAYSRQQTDDQEP